MSDVEIKKLQIKIGKKEVNLSIDEAKQLHAALGEMFGKPERVEKVTEVIRDRPYYWPWQSSDYRPRWSNAPVLTCDSTSGSAIIDLAKTG